MPPEMMGEEDDCIAGLFDFIVNFQLVIEYPKLIAAKVSHISTGNVKEMRGNIIDIIEKRELSLRIDWGIIMGETSEKTPKNHFPLFISVSVAGLAAVCLHTTAASGNIDKQVNRADIGEAKGSYVTLNATDPKTKIILFHEKNRDDEKAVTKYTLEKGKLASLSSTHFASTSEQQAMDRLEKFASPEMIGKVFAGACKIAKTKAPDSIIPVRSEREQKSYTDFARTFCRTPG